MMILGSSLDGVFSAASAAPGGPINRADRMMLALTYGAAPSIAIEE